MRNRSAPLFTVIQLLACIPLPAYAQQADAPAAQWEADIRAFEEADRQHPPPEGAVLFAGSSSIRLWQSLQEDFPDRRVVNRGFGGSELEDLIHYANRIILPYRPATVVVYAGDNDLAAGKTPERVFADYKTLVRTIHRQLPEAEIAFIAIKPSIARWHLAPQIRAANDLVEREAARDDRLHYIDIFTPMLGPDGKPREALFQADGLHLNEQGYALWKKVVGPALK